MEKESRNSSILERREEKQFSSILKSRKREVVASHYGLRTITDRTLDIVFLRFLGFSFTITLRQKPKGVTRMLGEKACSTLHECNSFGLLPQGYCEGKTLKGIHLLFYLLLLYNLCFTLWISRQVASQKEKSVDVYVL